MAPETLVEKAAGLGIEALVLTDINNSTGMVDFVKTCRAQGIHPVAGMEYREGDRQLYTGIARNPGGFRALNEFLSYHNETGLPLPQRAPNLEDVYFVYDFQNNPWKGKGRRGKSRMREQELIGVRPGEVNSILTSPWSDMPERLVIRQPVSFPDAGGHALHRHLRAIDNNTLLSRLKSSQMADQSEVLLSPDLLRCAYEGHPAILRNTDELLKDCWMDFDFASVKNKKAFTGSIHDDRILLEKLAREGMEYRYGKNKREALRRIRHELEIIHRKTNLPKYPAKAFAEAVANGGNRKN